MELSRIDPSQWEKAKQRLTIIKPFLDLRPRPSSLIKQRASEVGLHYTTLYEWIRHYENGGRILTSLLDRKTSVPKGAELMHPEIEALLTDTIEKYYLTPQRQRAAKIDEILFLECKSRGISVIPVVGDGNYHKPHINTIRKRIKAIPGQQLDSAREGREKASKYEARGTGLVASYPMEIVQIDHTRVDVFLRDEQTGCVLGRPWITIAIDVFSRMVVGYYVAFEAPSALSVGLCISQLILSKETWLRERVEYFGQLPEWPCYGRPVRIHVDNAREFRGDVLKRACEKHDIDINFRPVKTPHYGGHIESYNDKLSERIHALPGTSFSNPSERGSHYDSESESVLSFVEFERWLANEILCRYHYRPHSGLNGRSPLQRWNQGFYEGTELGPARGSLPDRYVGAAAERLRMDLLPSVERIISERGVDIHRIQYWSDTLRQWIRAKDPEHPKRSRYFVFRYDPRDISRVYFWNPELNKYETIKYRNTHHAPATLWELRAARERLRSKDNVPDRLHTEQMIFNALRVNRTLVEEAARRKGKTKAAGRFQSGVHSGRPQASEDCHRPARSVQVTSQSPTQRRAVLPFTDVSPGHLPPAKLFQPD